jgi:uncharacterized protein YijF (DUF1287 family)
MIRRAAGITAALLVCCFGARASNPDIVAQADYLPGDIVAWDLGRGILHIGIVGDATSENGSRYVIHNIGVGAREENILFRYRIIGHYRLPAPVVTR